MTALTRTEARTLASVRVGYGVVCLLKGLALHLAGITGGWVVAAWCLLALSTTLGVWARWGATGLVLLGGFLTLTGSVSNHLYLMMLVGILLSISDSERHFALVPRGDGPIRAWPLFLLASQLSVVYGFAALAKLNGSWLSGHALGAYFGQALLPVPELGSVIVIVASVVIVLELSLAVAPWVPKLRSWALLVAVVLHVGMLSVATSLVDALQIGLLGILMLVLFLPFFAPSLGLGRHSPEPSGAPGWSLAARKYLNRIRDVSGRQSAGP